MSYSIGISNIQQPTTSITPSEARQVTHVGVAHNSAGSIADAEHADQASLSSTGGLVAQVFECSDVRVAKVESLQQAIAAGNHSVSSSDVADKIIRSLSD